MQRALARVRRDQGLVSRSLLDDWLNVNELDAIGLERLLETEIMIEAAEQDAGSALDRAILEELKLAGRFGALSARAAAKREALGRRLPSGAQSARLPPAALLFEWFSEQTECGLVASDVNDLVRQLALPDLAALEEMIAKEFLFRQSNPKRLEL
jgi:hypothetical protein